MQKTVNYNLLKPGEDDFYDVGDFNQNADIIDSELKRLNDSKVPTTRKINGKALTGDITLSAADVGGAGASHTHTIANVTNLQSSLDGKESLIKNAAVKASLADADTIPLSDSAAANAMKKITLANLKAVLKTYFDGFYNKYVHPTYSTWTRGLYKITVDNTGHVSGVTAVTKEDITLLGLLAQDKAPNKNLLINWDFRNPVNQRGQNVYDNTQTLQYCIDRWCIGSGINASVISGGVRLTCTREAGRIFDQPIEMDLSGETVTFSVLVKSLSAPIYMRILNHTNDTIIKSSVISTTGIHALTAVVPEGLVLCVRCSPVQIGVTADLVCAKLELGPVSTLANDPPANYGEQLALCQRYFQRFRSWGSHDMFVQGAFSGARDFVGTINLGTIFRRAPTITSSGNVVTMVWGGVVEKIISIYFAGLVGNALTVAVGIDKDVPVGSTGVLRAWEDPNAYIDFDAEIY